MNRQSRLSIMAGFSLMLFFGCSPKEGDEKGGKFSLGDLFSGGGSSESRSIIGGKDVDADDVIASSTVGILDKDRGAVYCSGTIVGESLVLTAGHCAKTNPRDMAVLFSNKIPKQFENIQEISRPVIAGRVTPQWPKVKNGQEKNWGDMALLRIQGTIPAGFKVAEFLSDSNALHNGLMTTIAGFGYVDGRRKTRTPIMQKAEIPVFNSQFSDLEYLFDQTKGTGACHGDSGGPAFIQRNGKLIVVGVTSRGSFSIAE